MFQPFGEFPRLELGLSVEEKMVLHLILISPFLECNGIRVILEA